MHIAHLRASREFDLNVVSEYNTWTTDLKKIQNNKKKDATTLILDAVIILLPYR